MSLSRLALRLAAVEALNPSALAGSGPWPTLAGPEVYDERLSLIAQSESAEDLASALASLENKPVIVVYTEETDVEPYTEKYPAKREVVTLVCEISIGAQGVVDFYDKSGNPLTAGTFEAPITDRQQAALLDVLEEQVRYILDRENLVPSARAFGLVAMETWQIHSDPQRAADRTLRLALRTVKFHIKVKRTQWPDPGSTPQGSGWLPSPLGEVAALLSSDSSGKTLCAALAAAMPGPTPLTTHPIRVHVDSRAGITPTVPTPTGDSDADTIQDFSI